RVLHERRPRLDGERVGAQELALYGDERRHPERAELVRERGEPRVRAPRVHATALEPLAAVDEEAPDFSLLDASEEPLHEAVVQVLERPFPNELEQPALDVLAHGEPDALAVVDGALGALVEAEVQPGLLEPRPLGQKVEAEQGLSRAGSAHHRGRRALRNAALQHLVEAGHAEPSSPLRVRRDANAPREPRFDPRIHAKAALVDLDRMAARKPLTAPQLADEQLTRRVPPDEAMR